MEFIRKNIGFIVWLFLPAYFLVLKNSIRNRHSHVLPNGLVIIHAHPVNNNSDIPLNQHKHTKTEIFFFQLLQVGSHNISNEIVIYKPDNFITQEINTKLSEIYTEECYFELPPRSPPFQIIYFC